MPIDPRAAQEGAVDEIDFIIEDDSEAAGRNTTELTGWELVVFELADEEEPGE